VVTSRDGGRVPGSVALSTLKVFCDMLWSVCWVTFELRGVGAGV
jgi:hypothetical protein